MSHEDNETGLSEIGALPGHIWPSNQQKPVGVQVKVCIIGNEPPWKIHPFNYRVPAIKNTDRSSFINFWTDIPIQRGSLREGGDHIECGQASGHGLSPDGFLGHLLSNAGKEVLLKTTKLQVGSRDLVFQPLQFLGGEPLGIGQGLLANKVFGDPSQFSFGHLKVIPKHLVEFDLQRFDPGPPSFPIL